MPYDSLHDLPEALRQHLPHHAQEIYLAAFNHAWDEYASKNKRHGDATREQTAHRVAWAAVKRKYAKDAEGRWRERV